MARGAQKGLGALEFLQLKQVPDHAVYLLLGSDDYLLEQALVKLRRQLVDPDFADFNHETIRCTGKTSGAQILDALAELPMMTDRRLLELRGAESLGEPAAEAVALALSQLEAGSGMTVAVAATTIGGRKKKASARSLIEAAGESGLTIQCQVSDKDRPTWVRNAARELKLKPASGALEALLERTGPDLRALHSHLERLAAYAGEEGVVSRQDVEMLVPFSAEVQTWRLTAAIRARKFPEANQLLDQLLAKGEYPGALLSYLNSYLVSLVQVESLHQELGSAAAVSKALPRKSEFQVRKALEEVGSWSPSELELAFEMFLRADLRIKTGSDPRLVLELLLLQLCSRRGRRRRR